MAKSVLIIGAGIAGLSTGCYAQMNGFQSEIFEMHTVPGGVCTAWKRQGYTFDGCIHHLAGTRPPSELYQIWHDLGALPRPMIYPEELVTIEGPDGQRVTLYYDPDRLEDHLKSIAPADAPAIEDYVGGIRAFANYDLLDAPYSGLGYNLKILPRLPGMLKWFKMPMAGLAAHFRTPFLSRAMPFAQYNSVDTPVAVHQNMLQQCSQQRYGWPTGGSLKFALDIARRYESLGGTIHYRAPVDKILVENGKAVGLRLADGTERRGDVVVSTAYGQTTIFDMLDGRYTSKAIRDYYASPVDRIDLGLLVSLGVDRDLSGEPHALILLLEEPTPVAGQVRDRLKLSLYGHDPSMAPQGKGSLTVALETGYRYWAELHQDPERYREAKEEAAETVIGLLERRFPGLAQQVEVVDVATPVTTERYTGNRHRFQASFASMLGGMLTGNGLSKTLPGLKGFYMAGQWANVPGLPGVAAMGRDVVRTLRHSQ
jgi:phytoene dehydrogenase-like protein